MFRIRRIYDDSLSIDREAIIQIQSILKKQFTALPEREIATLLNRLRNPLKYRFRSILFVADDGRGKVKGFALLLHAPDVGFCYLDFISVRPGLTGGGVGGALYYRVREMTHSLGAVGIFFECLPDDPALCRDEKLLRQNRSRLKFYEDHGAFPIMGTAYETPLVPGGDCPPYLLYDFAGSQNKLTAAKLRVIVRTILERKYGHACPPGYIETVVASIKRGPVRLRAPRYSGGVPQKEPSIPSVDRCIILAVNDRHAIHHVHERGYVESPVRIKSILEGISSTNLFIRTKVRHFPERIIKEIHERPFVEYLKRMSAKIPPGKSVYPYVFPLRNTTRPPREMPIRAGYYCIDTFTPLNRNAYLAAKGAVDCSLTAATSLLKGYRIAYALVRPPGHHAESRAFGGFCYFNSAAVAAHYLSAYGPVAVLDIDYHHGNGTQEIFYERSDVLTLSIHGSPDFAYPYFSGFNNERGQNGGRGFNVNYPLSEALTGEEYRKALRRALRRVQRFRPRFLVVALGLDTAKDDPTGTWSLAADDFGKNGRLIGMLKLPTLIVQEGGYRIRSLGKNVRNFFLGLCRGASEPLPSDRLSSRIRHKK
ncbi:MAG: histone deacetylase family protein [Deltaproteobacteria bacterium]|nr:histone deacetylase family protein [Deltaproteobacteria bacterium]